MILICCQRISVRPKKITRNMNILFTFCFTCVCVFISAPQSVRAGADTCNRRKTLENGNVNQNREIFMGKPLKTSLRFSPDEYSRAAVFGKTEQKPSAHWGHHTRAQAWGLGWALWVSLNENWKLGGNFIDTCSEIRTIQFGSIVVGVYCALKYSGNYLLCLSLFQIDVYCVCTVHGVTYIHSPGRTERQDNTLRGEILTTCVKRQLLICFDFFDINHFHLALEAVYPWNVFGFSASHILWRYNVNIIIIIIIIYAGIYTLHITETIHYPPIFLLVKLKTFSYKQLIIIQIEIFIFYVWLLYRLDFPGNRIYRRVKCAIVGGWKRDYSVHLWIEFMWCIACVVQPGTVLFAIETANDSPAHPVTDLAALQLFPIAQWADVVCDHPAQICGSPTIEN